jgi:hypothetical protein
VAVEVTAAVVDRTEVAAEGPRTAAAAVAPEAVAAHTDRTDIKNSQQRPALESGRAFFLRRTNILLDLPSQLLGIAGVY